MIKMKLQEKGIKELVKKFDLINTKKLPEVINRSLDMSGILTLNQLKANTPVDTGNLRDSIKVEKTAMAISVGPDEAQAPYAKWVEFGHHLRNGDFLKGQFYVMKTRIEIQGQIFQIFWNNLKTLF